MQRAASPFEETLKHHLASFSDSKLEQLSIDYHEDTMVVFKDLLPDDLRESMH